MASSLSLPSLPWHGLTAPTARFPWPTLPLDPDQLMVYLRRCEQRGIGYALGAKATTLTALPPDYHVIDCSGWARAALAVATRGRIILPDGSVRQHDWCEAVGLKRSAPAALLLPDGWLRIAFLVPTPARPVGHVFLCRNGRTLESWGGHGPGSRSVLSRTSEGILARAAGAVFILGGK